MGGYCTPYNETGDLCSGDGTKAEHVDTCFNARSDGYLQYCCEECAQRRCSHDGACVGYTHSSERGEFKLKSLISDVSSLSGYRCVRKVVSAS